MKREKTSRTFPILLFAIPAIFVIGAFLLLAIFAYPFTQFFYPGSEQVEQSIISNSLQLHQAWEYTSEDRMIFAPKVESDLVFIKTTESSMVVDTFSKSKLIAIDPETGKKFWETEFNGLFNDIGPIVVDNVVITAIDAQRALRGLEKSTGKKLWETSRLQAIDYIYGLANDDSSVYVASGVDPVQVYALNPASGQTIWKSSITFPARSLVNMLYHQNRLYILFSTEIFVLEVSSGNLISRVSIPIVSYDQPTYDENSFYIDPDKGIWAISFGDLKPTWSFRPDCILQQGEGPIRLGRYFLFTPTPIGDSVYITGGCKQVFALDQANGSVRWTYDNKGTGTISHVASIVNIGYILFSDGTIRGIDLRNAREVGRIVTAPLNETRGINQQGIASWNNYLYFHFGGKKLFAYAHCLSSCN